MIVFADNASTTKIDDRVWDYMCSLKEQYGNPSSNHSLGKQAREIIDNAREIIANKINASPEEIYFVSSGTEANNLAILGFINANMRRGQHIITTQIEHAAVIKPMEYLQENGYDVSFLPVNKQGRLNLDLLQNDIYSDTFLISIMLVNNETGVIQDIAKIGNIAKKNGIVLHSDCVAAMPHIDINVKELGLDIMSISGHKIFAPKGIGILYINKNINIKPIIFGGGQEFGLRSGTENVLGIAGLGKAVEILTHNDNAYKLTEALKSFMLSEIPDVHINSPNDGIPILNISFEGVEGNVLAQMLSDKGIYVSTGSACSSNKHSPSHVLKAIGLTNKQALSSVRFSFGKYNTYEEILYIQETLINLISKIRNVT